MEQLIVSIRQLLDDKAGDNATLHRHVAELQAELERTQRQVLELADIVQGDKQIILEQKTHGSAAASDVVALTARLLSTEAELQAVQQSRDMARAGKAQMEHEIVSEKAMINDSRKEFEAWHVEMNEKQRLRDQLELEQERLVTSLEENLATKKKELTLLAANKQAEHLENTRKIAELHKTIKDEQNAHNCAVRELEEQHAAVGVMRSPVSLSLPLSFLFLIYLSLSAVRVMRLPDSTTTRRFNSSCWLRVWDCVWNCVWGGHGLSRSRGSHACPPMHACIRRWVYYRGCPAS